MCTNFRVDPNPKANLRQRRHIVLVECVCVRVGVLYSFVHFINIRLSFLRVGLCRPACGFHNLRCPGTPFSRPAPALALSRFIIWSWGKYILLWFLCICEPAVYATLPPHSVAASSTLAQVVRVLCLVPCLVVCLVPCLLFFPVLSCWRLKCRLMNWSGGDMCVCRWSRLRDACGMWQLLWVGHSACLSLIFCT